MKNMYGKFIENLYKEHNFEVYCYNNDHHKAIEVKQIFTKEVSLGSYIPTLFINLDFETGKFNSCTRSHFFDDNIKRIKIEFEKYFKLETIARLFTIKNPKNEV
jgi:hypothetical protein